jgi:16S rRNA (guanine527-N7)-methyltransferase
MADISALRGIVPVSRETAERLEEFVALLRKWQPAENLISPATLNQIWSRHVADSAQLAPLFPETRRWLDIGTGAGFPGLVVAILDGKNHVDLMESNRRKCAFLRQVIREIGVDASVHEGRAEDLLANWSAPVDRIVARAVAPLSRLFELVEPLMTAGVPAAFHKGADFQAEIDTADKLWEFATAVHPSRVGAGGAILDISGLKRKPPNQVR